MKTIRNINDEFGMEVSFSGDTINDCIVKMQTELEQCDFEHDGLTEGVDYEIVNDEKL